MSWQILWLYGENRPDPFIHNTQGYNYTFPNLSLPGVWESLNATDQVLSIF